MNKGYADGSRRNSEDQMRQEEAKTANSTCVPEACPKSEDQTGQQEAKTADSSEDQNWQEQAKTADVQDSTMAS